MTKKVESASEKNPEQVDMESIHDKAMRWLANELQGLKTYCVEHSFSFDTATNHYQSLLRDNPGMSIADGVAQTRHWVEQIVTYYGVAAAIGFPKERATAIFGECLSPTGRSVEKSIEMAQERMAAEIREHTKTLAALAQKMTIAIDRATGRPVAVSAAAVDTHEQRIRKILGR